MKSLFPILIAAIPAFAAAEKLAQGLLVTEYPRHVDQIDASHGELALEKFGAPIGSSFVTESITPWRHTAERNAIARGFLQIDADGDYAFTTNSFYDRNMLMIDGEVVCGAAERDVHPARRDLVDRPDRTLDVRGDVPGEEDLVALR